MSVCVVFVLGLVLVLNKQTVVLKSYAHVSRESQAEMCLVVLFDIWNLDLFGLKSHTILKMCEF